MSWGAGGAGEKDPVRGSCCDSEKRLRTVSNPGVRFLSQTGDFGSGMQRAQVCSWGELGLGSLSRQVRENFGVHICFSTQMTLVFKSLSSPLKELHKTKAR